MKISKIYRRIYKVVFQLAKKSLLITDGAPAVIGNKTGFVTLCEDDNYMPRVLLYCTSVRNVIMWGVLISKLLIQSIQKYYYYSKYTRRNLGSKELVQNILFIISLFSEEKQIKNWPKIYINTLAFKLRILIRSRSII